MKLVLLIVGAGFIFVLRYKMVQSVGSYTRSLSAFGGNLMDISLIRKAGLTPFSRWARRGDALLAKPMAICLIRIAGLTPFSRRTRRGMLY